VIVPSSSSDVLSPSLGNSLTLRVRVTLTVTDTHTDTVTVLALLHFDLVLLSL